MLTFANPKGRGIFDQFEDLKDELQASKIMQSQFQDTQNRLVERLGMLENEVGVLKDNDGNDGGLFKAIDRHASYITYAAEDGIVVEPNIEQGFQLLVKAVEDNWPHTPEEERSPIARAYYDFLKITPERFP
ncbi:hypothetical protein MMC14_009808 [Varicellaria rhodocarpa]|nr:hypothetical protein [Varicellaria rhodocarpa]